MHTTGSILVACMILHQYILSGTINDEMDAGQRKLYFEGGSRRLIFVYFWLVPYGTMLQMVFHHIKCFEITTVIVYLC